MVYRIQNNLIHLVARLDEGEIISHEYAAMNNKQLKDIFQAVMYFTNYFNTLFLACLDLKALGEIIRCLVKVQRQNFNNSS